MARIRTIKPEFWTSEQVIELSMPARLLFIGMWNFCDDRGVMPAAIKSLKAKVLPADECTVDDVQGLVDEMVALGLVLEFEAESKRWWYVTGWKHQVINRPTPSKFPNPPLTECSNEASATGQTANTEDSLRMSRAHSPASEPARMSRAHSPAADSQAVDFQCHENGSLSAHGGLTEDSPLERKGKERKGKEEERESARETKPPDSRPGQARGARLSLTELPPDWRDWALGIRPDLDPYAVWEKFSDYWTAKPGQGGCKLDWKATWRNWVRDEKSRGVNGHGQHQAHQSARQRAADEIRANFERHDWRNPEEVG